MYSSHGLVMYQYSGVDFHHSYRAEEKLYDLGEKELVGRIDHCHVFQ